MQGLEFSLEQKLVLSTAQIQSLEILSFTNQELDDFLKNEYFENPMLENDQAFEDESINNLAAIYEDGESYSNSYSHDYTEEYAQKELRAKETITVRQLAIEQLRQKDFTKKEWELIEHLIQYLDDDGFCPYTPEQLATSLGYGVIEVKKCLTVLKTLEPRGLFFSGMEEYFIFQLKELGINDARFFQLITSYLGDILRGNFSNASRQLSLSTAQIKKYLHIITQLHPKPLLNFSQEETKYIVPDILVHRNGDQWEITLNDSWMGTYQCNEFYIQMMKKTKDAELYRYFENKLKRAVFVLNSVERRRETLTQIMQAILLLQEKHFLEDTPIRPMIMRDVANEIGMSESTVSRAIRGKYMIYKKTEPLRDFFSGKSIEGNQVTGETIKKRLRELIQNEDKRSPLSDIQIVQLMKKDGIDVSRRTISKYRMQLLIPDSRHR